MGVADRLCACYVGRSGAGPVQSWPTMGASRARPDDGSTVVLPAALPPIPGEWITQGGAVGLLTFVAVLVFLGWLIPRSTHVKQIAQLERDRDQWREVALKAMGHAEELLPAAHITSQVTRVLAERAAPGGATLFDVAAVERALGGAAQPPKEGGTG